MSSATKFQYGKRLFLIFKYRPQTDFLQKRTRCRHVLDRQMYVPDGNRRSLFLGFAHYFLL